MTVAADGRIAARREPGFLALVASDVQAWSEIGLAGDRARSTGPRLRTALRLLWTHVGMRATLLYRISHSLHRSGVRVLPGCFSRLNVMLFGLDIPATVPIGPRLYIPHPVGTVVTAKVVGSGLTLVSCVTIGMRNEPAFPVIGDNVYVGAGARILGGITIGNDVAIGANAVVLRDVPDNSVAVGVPATIRARKPGTRPARQ